MLGMSSAAWAQDENVPDARDFRERVVDAGTSANQVDRTQSASETDGIGFYRALYEELNENPYSQAEEAIQQRFGIDFDIDLQPAQAGGAQIFTDFYENKRLENPVKPTLKNALDEDCVRIRAAQVDDDRRWHQLVKQRLVEKGSASLAELNDASAVKAPDAPPATQAFYTRLADVFDEEARTRIQKAIEQLPDMASLSDAQRLISCYQDFSREVEFELRLQSLLQPSRRQLEALQIFMNGELEKKPGFPVYDLVFDLDVIDFLFFGESIDTGIVADGSFNDGGRDRGQGTSVILDTQQLLQLFEDQDDERSGPQRSPSGASVSGSSSAASGSGASTDADEFLSHGFGSNSANYAGPFCVDEDRGVNLVFTDFEDDPEEDEEQEEQESETDPLGPPGVSPGPPVSPSGSSVNDADDDENEANPVLAGDSLPEGFRTDGLNAQQLCEGTAGFDLNSDFFRFVFCIKVSFDKVGKTWKKVRDNCISCHIAKMNQTFEQQILSRSVRPKKNTGTIMESGVCEDGFGDDIGFHFFYEKVPVKFYPDICYPNGGVSDDRITKLTGYPELVSRVNKPGYFLDCEADFPTDVKAQDRCKEVVQGNALSYEQFVAGYLQGRDDRITDVDDVDRSTNVWARLVGDHGIAQRELHVFLYRTGQQEAWYPEEKALPQDYRDQLQKYHEQMKSLHTDKSLGPEERLQQLLCLKGYAFSAVGAETPCGEGDDNLSKLDDEITEERARVMSILKQWNQKSADFNKKGSCGAFEGSGPFQALWDGFLDPITSGDYYLDTNFRRTQNPQEQVAGQIIANTDIQDLSLLFQEIDKEVSFNLDDRKERELRESESDQDRVLLLQNALGTEMLSFKSHLQAISGWWFTMVADDDQFVSRSGQKINALESFLDKSQN